MPGEGAGPAVRLGARRWPTTWSAGWRGEPILRGRWAGGARLALVPAQPRAPALAGGAGRSLLVAGDLRWRRWRRSVRQLGHPTAQASGRGRAARRMTAQSGARDRGAAVLAAGIRLSRRGRVLASLPGSPRPCAEADDPSARPCIAGGSACCGAVARLHRVLSTRAMSIWQVQPGRPVRCHPRGWVRALVARPIHRQCLLVGPRKGAGPLASYRT